ncbi:MAG: carboxymuconolactone decarboxylase family protein [Anaerolineales bacterium]|jgi:alkylhydroperoxidase/carboxymuconolactone decarboxylase family protein YurZ
MEVYHELYAQFKERFPEVDAKHQDLGQEIHVNAGPLPEKTRWLMKMAISGACKHQRALETHIRKAKAAGVGEQEILHGLLLLIPTAGFPVFMEAYSVFQEMA